ncbi:MAG TPA: DUF1614 domain-containing protein [Methanocorpusculum sp.]|nr:DUF1614 domain-containing protein [Methanocorpusculum sp.]
MSRFFFSPVSGGVLIVLVLLVIIGIPLLFFGFIGAAFAKLGLGFWAIAGLIIACIVGSFINIPLGTLYPKSEKEHTGEDIPRKPRGQYAPSMYDKMYNTDRFVSSYEPEEKKGTQIFLNVGGALVPILISVYVLVMAVLGNISSDPFYVVKMLIACVLTAVAAYFVARPVQGIGVALPFFVMPLITLVLALVLGWGTGGLAMAGIAYFAGTVGTLVGGDLLHLRKVIGKNTPMLSIGGAGMFDGIFLTGVVTALLASIF